MPPWGADLAGGEQQWGHLLDWDPTSPYLQLRPLMGKTGAKGVACDAFINACVRHYACNSR